MLDSIHGSPTVHPVFISVDPARDTPAQIARYVADFHPRFVGLRGDYAATKAACKSYRVYFSTPKDAKASHDGLPLLSVIIRLTSCIQPTDDYLVDHSIFVYLMDPAGEFVEAFGQSTTTEDIVKRFEREYTAWQQRPGGESR